MQNDLIQLFSKSTKFVILQEWHTRIHNENPQSELLQGAWCLYRLHIQYSPIALYYFHIVSALDQKVLD